VNAVLPAGVSLRRPARHVDQRGDLAEIFRRDWDVGPDPVQWNLVRNRPNTLRGVHAHVRHSDYLMVVTGQMRLALKDIRSDSLTLGLAAELDLCADDLCVVIIPPGVAHGFHCLHEAVHLYAVTDYWSPSDELGCAWNDPDLGFDWPLNNPPLLSERDNAAGSLADLIVQWTHQSEQPTGG